MIEKNTRYMQAKKVTLIGAAFNLCLGIIKTIGGILFHSHGLVADGIHSFSDLITDAMVLVASKYGSQDADLSHPYGHQRIETAATAVLAVILILAGIGIAWDSLIEITHHTHVTPGTLALPLTILSILTNEWLYHYTMRIGKRIQSELIIANAWHHRSDAASSFVVVIGLIGTIFGFDFFDPLAAIVVGCMVIKMGLNYGWTSLKQLVDTGVDLETLSNIEQTIYQVQGVCKIHQLRSRLMGNDIFIDVHLLVNPRISVSEGHFIAQNVHRKLIDQIKQIKDVTVHIDPEDDEIASPSSHLPSRLTLEKNLFNRWHQDFPIIESCMIHYLDGKVSIDIICHNDISPSDAMYEKILNDLTKEPFISNIRLLTHVKTLDINGDKIYPRYK